MSRFNWAKVDLRAFGSDVAPPDDTPPKYAPRLLFFSGGTALAELSGVLPYYSGNSIHIITTFDSGGSSAALRKYLGMPAVGDLRSRLISLSGGLRGDDPDEEKLAALNFWNRRFPGPGLLEAGFPPDNRNNGGHPDLPRDELARLAKGEHPWLAGIRADLAEAFSELLSAFFMNMPDDFHLGGACLGNLMLAGGYLMYDRGLVSAVEHCSGLLGAQGRVCPVGEQRAHLAVRYASSRLVVGQHLFSSKILTRANLDNFAAEGPIRRMWFTSDLESLNPVEIALDGKVAALIGEAELICYPFGSFYSSLLANLLPVGTGAAIAANPCPKLFIPNPGADPELLGHSLREEVEVLLDVLCPGGSGIEPRDVLDAVVVDAPNGLYPGGIPDEWLAGLGVAVVDYPFGILSGSGEKMLKADPHGLCRLFMSVGMEAKRLGRV